MNFSLTPNLEQFVRDRADSGDYNNASEVVREALRLLKKHEEIETLKLQKLKIALKEADNDLKNGDFVDLETSEVLDRFFAEL
ncbi:type II toxin-antitoxin system ParD family antitoxin [Sneathiella sp. P13V-1]|uniref:type II toxin-antitoxin system ParD family antitoxin n=1 Tax=Sneathiella sp. P13V-1 TaxID=2697366 RepID=UPI00187B55D0|nr:type II toxin-antitoxin system ParD family antitoxin [Sneathiella sp. P13V-1]MBE7635723.1 type II toxin-antitoxin system ParD family antitoxin [Sneathiella sp. P13V-1]